MQLNAEGVTGIQRLRGLAKEDTDAEGKPPGKAPKQRGSGPILRN